ncbi:MAG: DUF348 domain-containing protein [Acutalibacter sp.]|nr:DUF348 domain-containing protein [Acutalibacter sp.]
MHGRHCKKAPRLLIMRGVMVLILALVFSVSSFATVMANTVPANVIDGDQSYTFSMTSTNMSEILKRAEKLGLAPLGPLDVYEQVGNTTTVNIRRGVSITVLENGKRMNLIAYQGDTVQDTLEDHNIILKDTDEVTPARDTVVTAGLSVEIRRLCQVTVTADGERKVFSILGGTVATALERAGVTLGDGDTANYEPNEPLFDKMNIRVTHPVKITITADGETAEYELAASSVLMALKKCGIALSEDDRLNVERQAHLTEGMHIVVTRVQTEEMIEREEIDYPVQYITSDSMYEDEEEVRTPGEKGEKEITYKLFYIGGELDGKEMVSEKIIKEPVPEVTVRGTKERETVSSPNYGVTGSAGTFVDSAGNTISYAQRLEGVCTAYYPINPTTSTGAKAGYGCIAVDPNIIPYGTRMYICSPDGSIVYGYGVACDTGGACMAGDIIADLCYDTEAECSIIGRRTMVIYILP